MPEKCLFAFLGDVVHEYAHNNDAKVVETLITVSHDIKIYVLHEAEEDICLVQSPIGAAASAQVLDTLVSCGCKKVIAVDSCGVLANVHEYDAREFGTKSHEKALLLGLDILRNYRTEGVENGSGIKYFGKHNEQ